jgi:hypothetical protein
MIPATVTYLGESVDGPKYQAAITQVSGIAGTAEAARAAFVADWNDKTGDELTEADFTFTSQ